MVKMERIEGRKNDGCSLLVKLKTKNEKEEKPWDRMLK
jgi:hypothetical protein